MDTKELKRLTEIASTSFAYYLGEQKNILHMPGLRPGPCYTAGYLAGALATAEAKAARIANLERENDLLNSLYRGAHEDRMHLAAAMPAVPAGAPDLHSAIEARRELAHIELYLSKSGAPSTVLNRIVDLRAALASAAPVGALTDEEIHAVCDRIFIQGFDFESYDLAIARAIEARIKGGAK